MKRILFVIDNLGSGGAQNQLTMLAVLLKKEKYEVDVFYYYPQSFFKERLDRAGIKTYFFQKRTKLGLEVVVEIIRLLWKNNYNSVISFLDTPNLYNIIASSISFKRVFTVISYRSSVNIKSLGWRQKIVYNCVNSLSNHVVFNSNHERENWIRQKPGLEKKSRTIYNIVDLELFKQRKTYQRNNKLLVIGSVGPDKNGLLVVEALSRIVPEYKVTLTWTGQKVFEIKERKNYIEAMDFAIDQNYLIKYWKYEEPVKDVHLYYQNFDALILASKVEGLPNVVCESMATGTPVIISNVLDHPNLVQEGINGYLFDPENADSLANAIKSIYTISDQEYASLGVHARRLAEEKFGSNPFINAFKEILNYTS